MAERVMIVLINEELRVSPPKIGRTGSNSVITDILPVFLGV